MEKIKRFIDCYLPITACNFRCKYCYITQQRLFDNKYPKLNFSSEHIRKALSKERLGGVSLLNICGGGETMLQKELPKIVYNLLHEGHYVMIVTNGTVSKHLNEILSFNPNLLSRLFFKFSFHFDELLRTNLMESFSYNVEKVKQSNASFVIELTSNDSYIDKINEIHDLSSKKFGAPCQLSIARNDTIKEIKLLSKYSLNELKDIWGNFKSNMFDFKARVYNEKRYEFCYAGDWSSYLNLFSGELKQCYCGRNLGNIYTDISKPINFEAIGNNCTLPYCYNGHAFLTLGAIPTLDTPTYGDMRNRVCDDGSEWLKPSVKAFFSSKLSESNEEYSPMKKRCVNFRNRVARVSDFPRRVINTMVRYVKRK